MNIFQFNNFRDYLKAVGPASFATNPGAYSLSNLSKRLGYSSHRTLAMVLKGDRHPSLDMLHRLEKYLGLSLKERAYLDLLVLKDKAKSRDDRQRLESELKMLRNKIQPQTLPDETWKLIHEWYFYVIKQLAGTPSFKHSISFIRERLGHKVEAVAVRHALATLKALRMLVKDEEQNRWRAEDVALSSTNDVPSQYLRAHHKGMIARALEAIDEQPIEMRCIQGLTLRFHRKHLPDAKKDLFSFMTEFNEKHSADDADDVYQLNIQLFSHTN